MLPNSAIPPHIEWMKTMKSSLKGMVDKDKDLKDAYSKTIIGRNVSELKPKNLKEAQMFFNLSLLFTLDNAQEIVVCDAASKPFDIVMPRNGLKAKANEVLAPLNSFKLPFEEMIVTFKDKGGYSPFFLQAFSLDEEWIDPKDSSRHNVYCVKLMGETDESFEGLDGLIHMHRAFMEVLVIPPRLPRVYFPCYSDSICLNCKLATATDIFDHLASKVKLHDAKYCFKNMRTVDNCKIMPSFTNVTYARFGMSILLQINEIIGKLYKTPKKIERIQAQSKEMRDALSLQGITSEDDRHYIEIKDNRYSYIVPKRTRESLGTHAPPVEHRRNSHERRLKSGKVITVKESIINKGKKKPVYIIKNI